MKFSVKYTPTSLFSLKDSNSTNSGAKSLFLPSPYAIKMAILNQAITIGGDLEVLQKKNSVEFGYVRDTKIGFYIETGSMFSVNNSFVKILKPAREGGGFGQTVAFREYLYLSKPLEIVFGVKDEKHKSYLQKYLHNINYFGKRGCFFQFMEYEDRPNETNVIEFNSTNLIPGVIQQYDDFDSKCSFDSVNSFSGIKTKRKNTLYQIPLQRVGSSKSYSIYRVL